MDHLLVVLSINQAHLVAMNRTLRVILDLRSHPQAKVWPSRGVIGHRKGETSDWTTNRTSELGAGSHWAGLLVKAWLIMPWTTVHHCIDSFL